jgi:ECF transporter S component (folate family)
MFVALTLLVGLLPTIPGSALKFIGFPLLLCGLLVGPRTGFAVGCLTDLILFSLRPTGFFFPGYTLTQGLTAMLPGLVMSKRDPLTGKPWEADGRRMSASGQILAYLRLLATFAATKLLTSVLMVSYFTAMLTGIPLQAKLVETLAVQSVHVPIYALLSMLVLEGLAQTDLYPRLLKARR